jgi:drug/metabolite transporter (DMT)-like permease
MQQTRSLRYYAEALSAVAIWGASFVATKVALEYLPPAAVVWLRFAIGLLVLGAAVSIRREWIRPRGRDAAYLALLGLLGITFHQWLQSTGLVTSAATTTGWIISSTPIFIALLGWLVLGERLTWTQFLGILIAVPGVLFVSTKGDLGLLLAGRLGSPGDLLILISAPNWAVFSICSRSGLKRFRSSPMLFYVMLFGWLLSTGLFAAQAGWERIPAVPWQGWLAIAFLGIFCSGLAYIAWYDALQALPVAQTGAFLYVEPIVTMLVAALVLQEELDWIVVVAGAVILLGVWLVNRRQPA